jgi:Plasmid pRiA4b ORF-3-like protein
MERQIFVLRVTLGDIVPPVWRQIAVPGGFTLDRLHRTVQLALGWQDCHLHSFEIGGVQYGVPDPDGMPEIRDEMDARLDAVLGKDSRLTYVYDFGDWWEHRITVEDVLFAEPDVRYPVCFDGEGACPPEDVGGAYGYARFLEALADPAHEEHDATREWFGDRRDEREFDAARATALMRRMA